MNDPNFLPIMESYYTIQGEGFHSGTPAYFIRLAGCNVGCHWCDVKASWKVFPSQWQDVEQIVSNIKQTETKTVVITGGEPLMYDLSLLTEKIKNLNFKTNIETSGAYPLTGTWDWICFSPKKFKNPLYIFNKIANELKIIVFNKNDLIWAKEFENYINTSTHLYLQPEWSVKKKVTPLIVEFVKNHPKWKISIQSHKYLNVP